MQGFNRFRGGRPLVEPCVSAQSRAHRCAILHTSLPRSARRSLVSDQPDDDRDRAPTADADDGADAGDRRSVWSRRVAIALLITFTAFVVLNVAVVLALLVRSIAP